MKVKCSQCKSIREIEKNVIISICPYCFVEMEEIKDGENNNR